MPNRALKVSLLVFRRAVMLGALCLPALTFANSCTTTTVNNLIGTSCSIGDVNYDFLSSGAFAPSFTGISAGDITFTPNGSDPLAPSFTLTGPFTETANSSNSGSASQNFVFFWNLSVTNSLYQIVSATSTTFDASLPNSPNFGVIVQGNNLGFTNSILQTGGPNTNPSTASIDLSLFPGSPDGFFESLGASAVPGSVATTSAGSMELQYQLAATPEPSSLLLMSIGVLAAIVIALMRRLGA